MPKSTAKKRCWHAFAEFIKLRDSPDGYAVCISCGKMVPYPNSSGHLHAGHYYPRSTTYAGLYFDERNVNSQCVHCNTFLEGNTQGYQKGLIKKYGEEILEDLELKKVTDKRRVSDFEYREMAKHYRELNRAMKKERGI